MVKIVRVRYKGGFFETKIKDGRIISSRNNDWPKNDEDDNRGKES